MVFQSGVFFRFFGPVAPTHFGYAYINKAVTAAEPR